MKTSSFIIDSGNNGYNMGRPSIATSDKKRLVITHNAGFFSCCTIALQDIVIMSRALGKLPDEVDRHNQYGWYKNEPMQSLIGHFFAESDKDIDCKEWFELTSEQKELQYTDYRNLNMGKCIEFRDKYFAPSEYILEKVAFLEEKYSIDYDNTIGVLYRGNDKNRECHIASYNDFIQRAHDVNDSLMKMKGLIDKKYIVAPDETEFLNAFKYAHPSAICMDETTHMPKKDSAVFLEMPYSERAEQAANFFATLIILSKCRKLISHSGNISMWAVIYRGHTEGLSQWRDGVWL
jgi:hypothetical protein